MKTPEPTHSVECLHCGGDHKDWNCRYALMEDFWRMEIEEAEDEK